MDVSYDSLDLFTIATYQCTDRYVFDSIGVENVMSTCGYNIYKNDTEWTPFEERCICEYGRTVVYENSYIWHDKLHLAYCYWVRSFIISIAYILNIIYHGKI